MRAASSHVKGLQKASELRVCEARKRRMPRLQIQPANAIECLLNFYTSPTANQQENLHFIPSNILGQNDRPRDQSCIPAGSHPWQQLT